MQADGKHLDLLVPLFDEYRQFYRNSSDIAGARRFLRDRIENGESMVYLAMLDGAPAGFVQLYPSFSSSAMRRIWILNDLFVSPRARRMGVGKALIERSRQLAASHGAKGLQLSTEIGNSSAQRLYEQAGFRRDVEFYHYFLPA